MYNWTDYVIHPLSTGVACAGVAATAAWKVYDVLVTNPLRVFYFKGAWWHNVPIAEVCFQMSGVEAKWWGATDEHMSECQNLAERNFESWDATVMTTLYFTGLSFVVVYMFCNCLIVRPIVNALKKSA